MRSSLTAPETEEDRKRHCWECLRRCLVCDFTQPACKRCSLSGTVCPGYDNAKPSRLKWLAPGRVTSRNRKPKGASSESAENIHIHDEITTRAELSRIADHVAIPSVEMRTDIYALIQAAEYYNTCIYQDLIPIHELGENPHIYRISPAHVWGATMVPDYLRLGMVCMTLSHRMNRTRNATESKSLVETFYRYRGVAIRSLNEELSVEHKRTSNIVIAGIVTLLLADAQKGASSNWRVHLEGVQRLITLRGGIRALAGSRSLEPLLLCLIFVAVIGYTTCPASDLTMTNSHLEELDFILEQYGDAIFPFQMCPPPLFADIIKINHLRMRATEYEPSVAKAELSQEAYGILNRIYAFSPEQWAETKPSSKRDWVLVGEIYQASVALYGISSLQSVSVLSLTSALRTRRTTLGQCLHVLLIEALSSPRIKRFMLWPLVLLGMEAVHGGAAMRNFVEKQLPELSFHVGSYAPLAAKALLERFWASGDTRWDACFDRPYVFITQIAVDTSRILPHAR